MSLIVELTTATDTVRRRIRDLLLASPVVVVSESQPTLPSGSPPTLWFKPSTVVMHVWVSPVWVALLPTFTSDAQANPEKPLKSNASGNLVLQQLIAMSAALGAEGASNGELKLVNTAGNETTLSAPDATVSRQIQFPDASGKLASADDVFCSIHLSAAVSYGASWSRTALEPVLPHVRPSIVASLAMSETMDASKPMWVGFHENLDLDTYTVLVLCVDLLLGCWRLEEIRAVDQASLRQFRQTADGSLVYTDDVQFLSSFSFQITGGTPVELFPGVSITVLQPAAVYHEHQFRGPYADDAAAAAYIKVGETYRKPGGTLAWRQA